MTSLRLVFSNNIEYSLIPVNSPYLLLWTRIYAATRKGCLVSRLWDRGFEIGHRNSVKFQRISTCADLSLMTFARTSSNILMVTPLMNERKEKASRFFTIIEGMHEIDMIFASEDRAMIDSHIHHAIPTLVLEHLGLVTCEVEDDEITTPGLFYEVTKGFAFHTINIIQMLSTTHELGIIIREEDMKRAMGVLMSN